MHARRAPRQRQVDGHQAPVMSLPEVATSSRAEPGETTAPRSGTTKNGTAILMPVGACIGGALTMGTISSTKPSAEPGDCGLLLGGFDLRPRQGWCSCHSLSLPRRCRRIRFSLAQSLELGSCGAQVWHSSIRKVRSPALRLSPLNKVRGGGLGRVRIRRNRRIGFSVRRPDKGGRAGQSTPPRSCSAGARSPAPGSTISQLSAPGAQSLNRAGPPDQIRAGLENSPPRASSR